MDVHLEFNDPFNGVIFVQQAFTDNACRWEGENTIRMNFSIPISGNYSCGTTLQPVSFT